MKPIFHKRVYAFPFKSFSDQPKMFKDVKVVDIKKE